MRPNPNYGGWRDVDHRYMFFVDHTIGRFTVCERVPYRFVAYTDTEAAARLVTDALNQAPSPQGYEGYVG